MTELMMKNILKKNKIVKVRGIKEDQMGRKILVQFGDGKKEWLM